MRKNYVLHLSAFLIVFTAKCSFAQLNLECNGRDLHSIYYVTDTAFYRIDNVDSSPSVPVLVTYHTLGIGGIGISGMLGQDNMFFISSAVGGTYHYLDDTTWVNTGHAASNSGAINLGGTATSIYNLAGTTNEMYLYNGTGNDMLLASNLGTSGSNAIFDVATDYLGNFYILYTAANLIRMFDSTGAVVDSFTTTGLGTGTGSGFAMVGDRFYVTKSSNLYEGIRTGPNVNFTSIATLGSGIYDIASCPEAGMPVGIRNRPGEIQLAVYPNPARDYVNITFDGAISMEVSDVTGKVMKHADLNNRQEYLLQTTGWTPGIYLIKILGRDQSSDFATLVVE